MYGCMESTVFCFKYSEGHLLGSSSEMSNIYCPEEFNTCYSHESHNSSTTRFLCSSSSWFALSM